MILFVTVGTTKFDALNHLLTTTECLELLVKRGFSKLVLQIGSGIVPKESAIPNITIEWYRLKPSTKEDISSASLVISHAGAGSVLDVLEEEKPLIAVINDDLMGNHQKELAEHLHNLGHLHCCSLQTLLPTLETLNLSSLKPLPAPQPHKFAAYLDDLMAVR